MYDAKVLADSISPAGVRLLTVQATFPRFILAEVNTHRMLSRNSASSRAIPPEQLIDRVLNEPFIPETFNKRVKGMGVGDPLSEDEQAEARNAWIEARNNAVSAAVKLLDISEEGVDKSRINRLLEPFLWHTAIITATEWDNFFALRDHPAAQPEFQRVACMMLEVMQASTPEEVKRGQWHQPLVFESDEQRCSDHSLLPLVSAARCARVSYDRQHDEESYEESVARAESLRNAGHMSPFEHPAQVPPVGAELDDEEFMGNFKGWLQLRKHFAHEENMVGAIEERPSWESVEALQEWKVNQ